jgi:hypothetical protein
LARLSNGFGRLLPNSVSSVFFGWPEEPNIQFFGLTQITDFGDFSFFWFRSDHLENWRASLKTEFSKSHILCQSLCWSLCCSLQPCHHTCHPLANVLRKGLCYVRVEHKRQAKMCRALLWARLYVWLVYYSPITVIK